MLDDPTTSGLRILSFDGGGIGVLSALIIVRELMHRIHIERRLRELPRPCDLFHLIGGTGTGGLVAILLGRLRMAVDEAIDCYLKIVRRTFSTKKILARHGGFSAHELEKVLTAIVSRYCHDGNDYMLANEADTTACKTVVYAVTADAIRAGISTSIRSYRVKGNQGPECTIVEATRATTATPEMFKPVVIMEQGIPISYIGGGLGCNNPTSTLMVEAELTYPGILVSCIISIGAGQQRSSSLPGSKAYNRLLPSKLIPVLEAIAMDCEKTHEEMSRRFEGTEGAYFRFNTEQGMQDIDQRDLTKLQDVQAHTRIYLQHVRVDALMKGATASILSGKGTLGLRGGNVVLPQPNVEITKCCPPPSQMFTGREDILEMLRVYFSGSLSAQRRFVLYGLGGAGKTQLALMFAHRSKRLFWGVFYIDATSRQTLTASFKGLAKVAKCDETVDDALVWLVSQEEEWLLIYNNADDPSIDLNDYFPACLHGNILITTRNQSMLVHTKGPGSYCRVSEMIPAEALQLLLRTSGSEHSECSAAAAATLTKNFGYFALAIVQAGAYIRAKQCGLNSYLSLYQSSRDQLLREQHVAQTDGYKLGVYATWELSYRQLNPSSAQLLQIMSFMHHESIREDFFEISSGRIDPYEPEIPLSVSQSLARTAAIELLAKFRSPSGAWDPFAFQQLIDDLSLFTLVTRDTASRTYSIHPLVQSWCRTRVTDFPARDCTTWVLSMCIRFEFRSDDYAFRRMLLPHVLALHQGCTQPITAFGRHLALVLLQSGYYDESEVLLATSLQASAGLLGNEHITTLAYMSHLATCYLGQLRWGEAEALLAHLVEMEKRILGVEHSETLTSMHLLGHARIGQKKWQEAEELLLLVVSVRRRLYGLECHGTLTSMHALAVAQSHLGQLEDAETLLAEVLAQYRRILGNGHPDTIRALGALGHVFACQDRLAESEKLYTEALDLSRRIRRPRHLVTLELTRNLAATYRDQGRLHDAQVLMLEYEAGIVIA